tara:strand:- start:1111 stop:1602 length:492 start_codon:yes stop_codon:yes gene_type:complete
MLIRLKNKDTLTVSDFTFKCVIGKNGIKTKKKEGDKSTPRGKFSIGKLYFRKDKEKRPQTSLQTKIITSKMGWCDDPKSKYYNKECKLGKNIKCEKLYRKDNIYDFLIPINYNTKKIIPYKGSAIFIHLTKNYKKTKGCIALKKKDFFILLKLINTRTKIIIS